QQTDVGMPGFDRREATVAAEKGMQMDLPRQRRAIEIGFEADKRLANAQKSPAQSTVEAAALAMRADDHARFPALFAGPGANRRLKTRIQIAGNAGHDSPFTDVRSGGAGRIRQQRVQRPPRNPHAGPIKTSGPDHP